jgi:hypothetical protein
MGFEASVCQPSTLRMLICPEASNTQNSIAAVSADGRLCFDPSFELLVQSLNCIRRARAAPLAWRQAGEDEQTVAGFLQAVGDGAVLKPPLADEGLAADFGAVGWVCRG